MFTIQKRHFMDKRNHLPNYTYTENKLKRRPWSKDETFKLIELYKEFPALWDSKSDNYKNRTLVRGAFAAIANVFDTSSDEIRRKIHNLNTQFCQEVTKIKKSKNPLSSKGIYHCKWEYFQALQFTKWAGRLKKDGENSESNNEDEEEAKINVVDEEPDVPKPFRKRKAHKKRNHESKSRKRKKKLPVEPESLVTSVNVGASSSKINDSMVELEAQEEATSSITSTLNSVSHSQSNLTLRSQSSSVSNIPSPTTQNAVLITNEGWQKCENVTSRNNVGQMPDMPTLVVSGIPPIEGTRDEPDRNMFSNRNTIISIGPTESTSYASPSLKADESQDFGNLMARKLRKYDGVTQSAIQNAIMGVFLNADLGIYEQARNSLSGTSTNTLSPSYTSSVDHLRHAQNMYSSSTG